MDVKVGEVRKLSRYAEVRSGVEVLLFFVRGKLRVGSAANDGQTLLVTPGSRSTFIHVRVKLFSTG